jgi:hypothetical protein
MPGNMFIPPPQRPNNPMMGLLTQLALMKVQHDWSMEERQLALENKKIETDAAKAEIRSKEKAEAAMTGTRFETPTGPVADPSKAYQQPEGSYYEPRYGQNVIPSQPEIVTKEGIKLIRNKDGGYTQLKSEKPDKESYSYFIRQDTMGLPPNQQVVIPLPKDQPAPSGYAPYSGFAAAPNYNFVGTNPQGAPVFSNSKTGGMMAGQMPGGVQGEQQQPLLPKGQERLSDMAQAQLNSFTKVKSSIDEINSILTEKPQLEKWMGPVAGRARSIASDFQADPDWVKFKNTNGQLLTLVYALSGKQTNPQEKKWLDEDILPQLKSPGPNYKSTLNVLNKWLERNYNIDVQSYKSSGHIVGTAGDAGKVQSRPPLSTFQVTPNAD